MGIFCWVAKISNIFFGVLEIPDIFLGWMVEAGSEPTYEEKIRVPPWGWSELYVICKYHQPLPSGPVLRYLTESSFTTTEINLWYFITSPLLRSSLSFFQRCISLYMYVHIFYYFSIYWSDTRLVPSLKHEMLKNYNLDAWRYFSFINLYYLLNVRAISWAFTF